MRLKVLRWLLVAAWMAVIWLFSAQDADSSDQQSGVIVTALESITGSTEDWLTFATRKAAHFLLYLVLGMLIYHAVRGHSLHLRRAVLLSVALALLYAVSDELHQLYSPGRSAEVRDVLIDTTAASAGIGLSVLLTRSKNLQKSQK